MTASNPTSLTCAPPSRPRSADVGDAYERMFLNAALGDQSLFVSADELVEMWRIFTPLLHQIDEQKPEVVIYPFGMVPTGWAEWAQARGAAPKSTWQEFLALNSDHVEELRKIFVELDVNGKGRLVAHLRSEACSRRRPTRFSAHHPATTRPTSVRPSLVPPPIGRLEGPEILELAKRFYDGREPTMQQIDRGDHGQDKIDAKGSGSVTWDEFVQAAGVFSSAFRMPIEPKIGWRQ